MGLARRLLYSLAWLAVTVVCLELGLRVFFATRVGSAALLYGIAPSRQELAVEDLSVRYHDDVRGGGAYSKYFPHQRKFYFDGATGTRTPVAINGHGFRGRDWSESKAPGVVRVVTLGASSTFGYGVHDDETYPVQMQRILNEEPCNGVRSFEVLNLGIPHLKSGAIASLFLEEALPLAPDVVTFYEGVNDSKGWPDERELATDGLQLPAGTLKSPLLLLSFASALLQQRERFSQAEVEEHLEGRVEHFLANLERIREVARERGILLVVGTQQAKSLMIPRDRIRGVSYAQEADLVRRNLHERGEIPERAAYFLVHQRLMQALVSWSRDHDVPEADVIRRLDLRRDELISYVHLSAEGNRIAARTFADAIRKELCPGP